MYPTGYRLSTTRNKCVFIRLQLELFNPVPKRNVFMFSRISTKDEEMDLPLFYWMHNLHNFPYNQRCSLFAQVTVWKSDWTHLSPSTCDSIESSNSASYLDPRKDTKGIIRSHTTKAEIQYNSKKATRILLKSRRWTQVLRKGR